METNVAIVELRHVSKSFDGVRVLRDVDLSLFEGEVHGLVGLNGSGKSTLIKILAGVYKADSGSEIATLADEDAQPERRPFLRAGGGTVIFGFVHQDLGLIESFSVADNFAFSLGYTRGPWGNVTVADSAIRTREALERIGIAIDPGVTVGEVGAADRALVAVARALEQVRGHKYPCLVLDEPTASLSLREADRVLDAIRLVAQREAAVLFVSHNLNEVIRITDRLTVLRDGRVVARGATREFTREELIGYMVGDPRNGTPAPEAASKITTFADTTTDLVPVGTISPKPSDKLLLEVKDLSGDRIRDVSFGLRAGEILGITGLVGCGKSELGRLLIGISPSVSGTMQVGSERYAPNGPPDSLRAGISYVPADRLDLGGILEFAARENISLSILNRFQRWGTVNLSRERLATAQVMEEFSVNPRNLEQHFSRFSGGNQQKLVFGRAIVSNPSVLILDEPTQGVDVSAIPVLYNIIRKFAGEGKAVLIISSDYEEIAEVAHSVMVLSDGKVTGLIENGNVNLSAILNLVFAGVTREEKSE